MSAIIELEIGPGEEPGTWAVRVLRSAGADAASASFRLDVDTLLTRLPFMDSTVLASAVPARRVLTEGETEIQRVGTELFSAVFTGEVEEAYRTSRAVAKERGESLQVRLRLVAPTLAALPWESLFDPQAGVYVCRKEPLIRQIPTTDPMEPLNLDPPLRVLAMVAAPGDLPAIDAAGERMRLETALGPHIARGRILVEWLDDVTWANVHEKLLSAPWHVLHFVGHGSYDSSSEEGVLAFVGPDGRAEYVDASALADLLDEAEPTPRLVVINSCMSGAASTNELYSGTAAALVNSGINAVAAMQFTISDAAAVAFSQGFYSALAYGRRIDEAVVSGRIAILGLGRDTLEWVTPVLCLRGDDTRLFIVPKSADDPDDSADIPGIPAAPPGPRPTPKPDPRRVRLVAAAAA
uniref:CHAT domain-containing protein n=1 Tax=Agromyces humi TaxID=1766800 RepID=UPI00135C529C